MGAEKKTKLQRCHKLVEDFKQKVTEYNGMLTKTMNEQSAEHVEISPGPKNTAEVAASMSGQTSSTTWFTLVVSNIAIWGFAASMYRQKQGLQAIDNMFSA